MTDADEKDKTIETIRRMLAVEIEAHHKAEARADMAERQLAELFKANEESNKRAGDADAAMAKELSHWRERALAAESRIMVDTGLRAKFKEAQDERDKLAVEVAKMAYRAKETKQHLAESQQAYVNAMELAHRESDKATTWRRECEALRKIIAGMARGSTFSETEHAKHVRKVIVAELRELLTRWEA